MGRLLFGFRNDLDLSQRWWHRFAKVAFVLSISMLGLWASLAVPAELPEGPGNIRVMENLVDYVKANPLDGDPVASFSAKYRYKTGKLEPDGTVGYAFFETNLYCAVKPYDHLYSLTRYLRPIELGHSPTSDDALALLKELKIPENDPKGYTCISLDIANTPGPNVIVGWEHTLRAQIIGNAQKFGVLGAVGAGMALVIMNLYYRGVVYIICGPRRKSAPASESV